METVKIYNWTDLRLPIIDKMVAFLTVPLFTYNRYVMRGIPKFPDGKSDKYLHEYIIWLHCETNILDDLIDGQCFIIQHKNTKLFFAFNELVYACNFAETIP